MASRKRTENPERRLLALVGDICGLLEIDELRLGLIDALHRSVPSRYISLNEIGPGPEDVLALMKPEAPERIEQWVRHAHENPLLQYYLRTQDGRAMRFSDVVSREELRALALYREVYRPMRVEHQIAFTLPGSPGRVLAIAMSRGRGRDYSDAERDFLNAARPFLIQAYLNAIAYARARAAVRDEATAVVRSLAAAGLTAREAEALRLVALGRSNQHVAAALGISHRTVGKHLERAFRKLGVGDRSSAAARVWELAGAFGE